MSMDIPHGYTMSMDIHEHGYIRVCTAQILCLQLQIYYPDSELPFV